MLRMDTVNTPKDTATKILAANSQAPVVSVFPNPSDNAFTINIGNVHSNELLDITITDIQGRPVYQNNGTSLLAQSGSGQVIWNAGNVNKGVYFYSIKMSGRQFTGKMVKM